MTISISQAREASETLEDVFAPDDDGDMMAGVVSDIRRIGSTTQAMLVGTYHHNRWVGLDRIELRTGR